MSIEKALIAALKRAKVPVRSVNLAIEVDWLPSAGPDDRKKAGEIIDAFRAMSPKGE